MPSGAVIRYAYDNKNNITHVYENDVLKIRYTYDAIGQLTREDNAYSNTSRLYNYDSNGNITSSFVYFACSFEGNVAGVNFVFNGMGYADAEWGDLLTSFNGVQFAYDAKNCNSKELQFFISLIPLRCA